MKSIQGKCFITQAQAISLERFKVLYKNVWVYSLDYLNPCNKKRLAI